MENQLKEDLKIILKKYNISSIITDDQTGISFDKETDELDIEEVQFLFETREDEQNFYESSH